MLKTYFFENNVVVLSIVAKEDMHACMHHGREEGSQDGESTIMQERQMDNN